MVTLKGKHIYLRALEPTDLDFIHEIENDESIWEISNTETPFSKYLLSKYIEESYKDIYEVKQLRLVISDYNDIPLGFIDLFDFDFRNKRAGIGILIKNSADRKKGIGSEALELLMDYSFSRLNLHQLYCNITEDNKASIKLFSKHGFHKIGLKKDWIVVNSSFKNEYLYQKIKE